MNADVEKAVEGVSRLLHINYMPSAGVHTDLELIVQALRDQEAEIARLHDLIPKFSDRNIHALRQRAEKAEALLRECRQMLPDYCEKLVSRITTNLGATP